MTKKAFTSSLTLPALLVAAACAAPAAQAASITVNNASFESQVLTDGNWTHTITGWVLSGLSINGGVLNPTVGAGAGKHFSNNVPDGDNVAWLDIGTISQTLSTTLAANSTYTLMVDVGDRKDLVFKPYAVSLLAGGNVLATESSLIPNNGFLTSVITFTTSSSSAYLGQSLGISLTSSGQQVDFDNVRLSVAAVQAVPEPTSVALFLAGLGWMGMAIRRRTPR
jgi:hypothetical protein